MDASETIKTLLDDVSKLPEADLVKRKALLGRTRMIISRVFGNSSPYLIDLTNITSSDSEFSSSWQKEEFVDLCNLMLEDLQPDVEPKQRIQSLLDDLSKLPHCDNKSVNKLQRRAELVITKVFTSSSLYLGELKRISFHPTHFDEKTYDKDLSESWANGRDLFRNLCNTMLEGLQLTIPLPVTALKPKSNKIFVVHGHDNEMKLAVARTIEQLGLEPIILYEQPDKGFTIIEKSVNYSDVGFAVVLLSPDDMGYPKTSTPNKARPRARQNVVLELGFFLGKLGRSHVLVLHRSAADLEMPSDYVGVIYKPFDEAGAWRFEFGRELKAAGYDIDLNKLNS